MAKKPTRKSPAAPAAAASGDADLDVLKELVKLLDSSSATTIKLERADASYEVTRGGMPMMPMPVMHSQPMAQAHTHSAPASPPPAAGHQPAAAPTETPKSNLIEIKSPMVGTFYRAPEPGADPYVKSGSRIALGQSLCIIEAMKIMNEIESEVTGTVREVAVEDASPVEFGQVLFRVEPHV